MSLNRYDQRRDSTERPIIEALEADGCEVLQLSKFDLLVHRDGKLWMLEVKSPKGKPTSSQLRLVERGFPLVFVYTVEEALNEIRGD